MKQAEMEREFWDTASHSSNLRDEWLCDANVSDRQCYETLQPLKNGDILEIGCGIGRMTYRIAGHMASSRVFGIDVSQRMLDKAEYNRHIEYKQCDGRHIPYPDSRFDTVYSLFVFQHLNNSSVQGYINETHRVLKSGGQFRFQFVDEAEEAPMSFNRSISTMEGWLNTAGFVNLVIERLIYPQWVWVTAWKK